MTRSNAGSKGKSRSTAPRGPGPLWGPRDLASPSPDRPFVYVNAAITADGMLAPVTRRFEPFSSRTDFRLLHQLRTHADAILCGARTLGAAPITMGNGGAPFTRVRKARGLADHPVRVIVSGSASIDPNAEIFRHRFSPILLLTTRTASTKRLKALRPRVDAIGTFGSDRIDFPAALRWLRREWNIRSLLCEGGGEVNGALFDARLVDELYLTWCPLIFGGRTAPSLADGLGADSPAAAAALTVERVRHIGTELYFVFRVAHRPNEPA